MNVAIVNNGVVVNMSYGADDFDYTTFDFTQAYGEGAYGVPYPDDQFMDIGFLYSNGVFTAPPAPEPTHEDLVLVASNEKYSRISAANSVFLEWQTKLLLNIASDAEKQAVTDWVHYLDTVKAIDVNLAPDIEWPDEPEVPQA